MVDHIWKNKPNISLFHMKQLQANTKLQASFHHIHKFHSLMQMWRLVFGSSFNGKDLFFCVFVNQVHLNILLHNKSYYFFLL